RQRIGCRSRQGSLDRPPGAQGEGAKRSRTRDRRPRRGARWRHRPRRATTVEPGAEARRKEAAADNTGRLRGLTPFPFRVSNAFGSELVALAVAIARRLHALWLARHLRVVGRVGHVAFAL